MMVYKKLQRLAGFTTRVVELLEMIEESKTGHSKVLHICHTVAPQVLHICHMCLRFTTRVVELLEMIEESKTGHSKVLHICHTIL